LARRHCKRLIHKEKSDVNAAITVARVVQVRCARQTPANDLNFIKGHFSDTFPTLSEVGECMASFYKRGAYQWEVKIRRRGYPSQTKTFETKAEALAWAREIENQMDRGTFQAVDSVARTTTLGDLLDRYIEDITPTHKGSESEDRRLTKISRHKLCETYVHNVTPAMLASYRDERLKSVAPASVVRELGLIQQVITHAMREWNIALPSNPVTLVKRPSVSNARTRRLVSAATLKHDSGKSEEELLLAACAHDPGSRHGGCRNIWLLPIVRFAIETAMRRSEILSLEWQHVDLEACVAFLPATKNGDSRHVPLTPEAANVLRTCGVKDKGPVFEVTVDALKQAWERAVERAGLKDLHFHDLRHEGVSRLSLRLTNILELSSVTGHKDLRMLKRYFHPDPKALAKKLAAPDAG
jgi:integrase